MRLIAETADTRKSQVKNMTGDNIRTTWSGSINCSLNYCSFKHICTYRWAPLDTHDQATQFLLKYLWASMDDDASKFQSRMKWKGDPVSCCWLCEAYKSLSNKFASPFDVATAAARGFILYSSPRLVPH